MQADTRSKLKLAFLLLVAFVPITMATFAFRAATDGGLFSSTTNKGELIMPPADITDLAIVDTQGLPVFRAFEELVAEIENPNDYDTQPWHIIYINTRDCDDACRERVHLLRQMHITLNKNTPRVRRYYVQANTEAGRERALSAETAAHFRAEFPSMGVAFSQVDLIEQNLKQKGLELDLQADNYIFFVDPVGNVMMYYNSSHSIADIKSDLEKLLRHSSLG